MKKCKLLLLALFFVTGLSAQNEDFSPLIVNEVGLMPLTNEKYIELLVVGDAQNPLSPVNLEGWILDNNSDAFSQDSMFVTLGAAFSNVSPGSIILIYDQTNPHPLINVQNDGLPNASGVYQLGFDNSALGQCVKETGFDCIAPPSFSTTSLAGVLPLSQTGDVVQVRAPNQTLQQAVSWAAVYAENGNSRTTRISDGGGAITGTISLDKTCGYQVTHYKRNLTVASPGAPNSNGNAGLIQAIAVGSVPATQNLSISCVAIPATATGSGSIQVSMTGGGLTSKIASWSGPSSGWMQVAGSGTFVIPNLIPGTYNVSVSNLFTQGCSASCGAEVFQLNEVSVCPGGVCPSIGEENPNPDYSYSWEHPSAFDDPNISYQQGVCVDEDTEYQLRIFDEDCNLVNTIKYDLKVHEPKELELSVLPGDMGLCHPEFKIKATEGFQSYNWSGGTMEEPNVILASSLGSFGVTATDDNGCEVIGEIVLLDKKAQAIKGMLEEKGAFAIPLLNIIPAVIGDDDSRQLMSSIYVTDHTGGDKVDIVTQNTKIKIADELQSFLDASYFSEYASRTSYVTNNFNVCADVNPIDLPSICSNLESLELGLWAHIWDNPDPSGTDYLYVLGKSPNQEGFASISEYGEALIAEEYSLTQPESLASMDAEIFYIVQDQLVDFYVADWQEEDKRLKTYTEPVYDPLLCGSIAYKNITALNPAGTPIFLGENTGVKYSKEADLKFGLDKRALTGFYKDGKVYYGLGTSTKFYGFKSEKSGAYYQFPDLQSNPPTGTMIITLGEYEAPTYNFECDWILLSERDFFPTWTPAPDYPTGKGEYVADFFNSTIGEIEPLDAVPYSDRKSISLCIPEVDLSSFENPIRFINNPDSAAAQAIFMEVQLSGSATQSTWIYGTFKYGSPDEIVYHIWDCDYGGWAIYPKEQLDDAIEEEMHFISALFDAIYAQGHTTLDIAGTIVPLLGEVFDVMNGVWYLAEGDFGNAGMSFASTIFPLTVTRISENLVLVRNSDNIEVRNIYFDIFKKSKAEFIQGSEIKIGQLKKVIERMHISEHLSLGNMSIAGDVLDYLYTTPGAFKAWELLAAAYSGPNVQRLWDLDLIIKIKELQEDLTFMERIGGSLGLDGADEALKKILQKNFKAPCATCASNPGQAVGSPHLKHIDEYLEDVRSFVINHLGTPPTDNANQILDLAKNGQEYQVDAIAQTVRYINEGIITDVSKFEPRLADHITGAQVLSEGQDVLKPIGNVGDVVLSTNPLRLMELKSWGLGTIDGMLDNVDFIAQTKGYFLTDISNIADDLVHSFDKRKLLAAYGGPFATEADALKHIKGKYRELFTEYIDIWEAELHQLDPINGPANFQALLAKFDADSMEDFLDLVGEVGDDIFDDSIFSFIKIQ